ASMLAPIRGDPISERAFPDAELTGDSGDRTRQRCWKKDWVIDLDIRKFFDSVRWDLIGP
ncbi:hypothetical protein, partial [Micromonospora sp. NPDC006431]|uniref:hypothetical protein n=1 Tax=Micromonospora sp. NPDC006431 TaxID=3364235 RepID=UPI003695795C